MELITWKDEFATGIPGVDYEHEELIKIINDFYARLTEHSEKDVLINILNDIYGAIYSHFALEERQMEKYGYDQYEKHCQDHGHLLDEIRDITIELEKTAAYDEVLLKNKLHDWFSVHFKTHDARLHELEKIIKNQKDEAGGLTAVLKNIFK